jgi:lysine-N-methylase
VDKRALAQPTLLEPPDQRFECRDCPARCCRVPWGIRLSDDETSRYLAEPWILERVGTDAREVIAGGVLPMRESARRLECVFLDDDALCGMQKEFGHGYIPRSCQVFPFGFVRDESDRVVTQLSQLCPSIRDSYGKPASEQLTTKLREHGGADRMSQAMATLAGVVVPQPHYLRVVEQWQSQLAGEVSPAVGLSRVFDWTQAFEAALPPGMKRTTDAAVDVALQRAGDAPASPLVARSRPSFHARVLFAYFLGSLCYPSSVRQSHRVERGGGRWLEALRAFGNKLAWMIGRGSVDMLFIPKPVALQRVSAVPRFLGHAEGSVVRDYLCRVLRRRHVFSEPRHLLAPLLDLALATAMISRFARCRAAAEDRSQVSVDDVREAIGVAEFLLLSHAPLAPSGRLIKNLRWLLLSKSDRFHRLLASEA